MTLYWGIALCAMYLGLSYQPTSNTFTHTYASHSHSPPPATTSSLGNTYMHQVIHTCIRQYIHALGNKYIHLQVMYVCIPLPFSSTVTTMYFSQVTLCSSKSFPSKNHIHWEWDNRFFFYAMTTIWQILILDCMIHHSKDSRGTFPEHSGWPQGH